jgi:MYXO-CTERM domain-containing protein
MKTNVKTSCAIGAVLFGGTLGAAHADVVGLQSVSGGRSSWAVLEADDTDIYSSGARKEASGNPASAAISFNDSNFGSFSLSRFQSQHFTLTRSPEPMIANRATVDVYFQIGSTINFSFTSVLHDSMEVAITHYNANDEVLPDSIRRVGGGAVNLNGTMPTATNGDYYGFHFFMDWRFGNGSETVFDLSFAPVTVPAPGALALLGVAGLAGRRRRDQS